MVNSGMLICSFLIKKRLASSEDSYALNKEILVGDTRYDNAMTLFHDFCLSKASYVDDEKAMKLYAVDSGSILMHDNNESCALSFTVKSGAYGIESVLTDRNTGKEKYRATIEDANIKQFKCLIYIPKDQLGVEVIKGIFIFQTIATYGIKKLSCTQLKEFFSSKGMTLETRNVSVRAFIEKLFETGAAHKITLIRNRVSPDASDNMLITSGKEERSFYKPQLKPNFKSKLLDIIEGEQYDEVFEYENDQYEDLKITFKLGNQYRTVSFSDISRFSIVEDIPHEIYNNGRFQDNQIIDYFIRIAKEYAKKMIVTRQE